MTMDTLPRVAYACALFNHISLGMKTWYVRLTNRFVAGLDNPISRRICSVGMLLGNRRISRDGLLLVSSRISSYDIVLSAVEFPVEFPSAQVALSSKHQE